MGTWLKLADRSVWAHGNTRGREGKKAKKTKVSVYALRSGARTQNIKRKPRKGIPGSNRRCSGRCARLPRTSPPVQRRSALVFFAFFSPPFRVLPCAHTERSANFGHVPIPAGSLGCCRGIGTYRRFLVSCPDNKSAFSIYT